MSNTENTEVTLSDYVDFDLNILSIGLNPSKISVARGYYFANPRNRFWKAFNQSEIINQYVEPDDKVHHILLKEFKIGFTDVAKRPSSMGHELRASDFKRDAPLLREKIELYKPQLLWFHGKVAVSKFMQYGFGLKQNWEWGFNGMKDIDGKVFVSPNPSPANAAFSLKVIVESYKNLRIN